MSDTTKDLAACLEYARIVNKVLPVDHEADRLAAEAMRRHLVRQGPPRKLKRKP